MQQRRGGPAFAVRAKGAYFRDVDGRQYLDYLLIYGPIILGHCDPDVNEAVRRQMEEGRLFSIERPAFIEFDDALCRIIPCAEMVINLIGGSSASMAARTVVRVLRERDGIAHIARLGKRLTDGLNAVFIAHGYPLRVRGWPTGAEPLSSGRGDNRRTMEIEEART